MTIPYKLKQTSERVGTRTLLIESLANLNETIDELFAELSRTGNEALLEDLCPYFGQLWPSGRLLAEKISELGDSALKDKRVLEIGCGLALPSLYAAKQGAQVIATDFHPEVPRFLQRNRELNGLRTIEYRAIDWRAMTPEKALELSPQDLIIGSDILYEKQHSEQVAQVLGALKRASGPGTQVIVTDPGRPYLQGFVDAMAREGLPGRIETRGEIFILEF